MKQLKPILLLVLVFVAGMFVGVVGTRATVHRWIQEAVQNPVVLRQGIEKRLTQKLKLDKKQQTEVRRTLARTQQEIRDLRNEFRPRHVSILSNAQASVEAVLTPAQRAKFEKMPLGNQALWEAR